MGPHPEQKNSSFLMLAVHGSRGLLFQGGPLGVAILLSFVKACVRVRNIHHVSVLLALPRDAPGIAS